MTFLEFCKLVSSQLRGRGKIALTIKNEGAAAARAYRDAGKILLMAGKYHESLVAEMSQVKFDGTPLVIIETEAFGDVHADAMMIGHVNAVFVDWQKIKDDPEGEGKPVFMMLSDYLMETGLPPEPRIIELMNKLISILEESEGDDESEDEGTYKGIPHTGGSDCPACGAAMKDLITGNFAMGEMGPESRKELAGRVMEILTLAKIDQEKARERFKELRRDCGIH